MSSVASSPTLKGHSNKIVNIESGSFLVPNLTKVSKICFTKADEANVGTSIHVESSNRLIQALETWACWQSHINTKQYETVKIGVEEGVDLGFGIEDNMLPILVS